jgi:hypothetical protein
LTRRAMPLSSSAISFSDVSVYSTFIRYRPSRRIASS